MSEIFNSIVTAQFRPATNFTGARWFVRSRHWDGAIKIGDSGTSEGLTADRVKELVKSRLPYAEVHDVSKVPGPLKDTDFFLVSYSSLPYFASPHVG